MEDFFDSFCENVTNWDSVLNAVDSDGEVPVCGQIPKNPRIRLFPRQDVGLYGTIPKMEQRIYTKCKDCKLIFNPQDILSHKTCPGTSTPVRSHASGRRSRARVTSAKKHQATFPPPPTFAEKPAEAPAPATTPTIDTWKDSNSSEMPPADFTVQDLNVVLGIETVTGQTSGNARSKKTKRGTPLKAPVKDFDPDLHCGVVEGNKGPCTRSITCSNHRIQLKKLVTGRSKDVHQLIADKRLAKDRESKTVLITELQVVEPVVPEVFLEPEPACDVPEPSDVEEQVVEIVDVKTEEPPILSLHEPMSPILIDSCEASLPAAEDVPVTVNKTTNFEIPSLDLDVPTYNSHPKPVAVPTFGMRKYGGALLFSNVHVNAQRNDVLKAINNNSPVAGFSLPYGRFGVRNNKRPNFFSSVDAFDMDSKQLKLDRKFSHFVLPFDMNGEYNGSSVDCMQENLGFKKL